MSNWEPPRLPEQPPAAPRLPDPAPAPAGSTLDGADPAPPSRPAWKRKRVWVPVAGLAAVVAIAGLAGEDDQLATAPEATGTTDDTSGDVSDDTTPSPTAAGSTAPSPDTVPATASPGATAPPASTAPVTDTAPSTAAPTPVGPPAAVAGVIEQLDRLVVADPDPARPPYVRDEYTGGRWADLDGDCITTRHDVLIATSLVPVTMSDDGCRVETGEWLDPYTGDVLRTADEATIDHMIPLAEAHRAGAWRWDFDTKVRLANDTTPGALRVVGGDVNQAKADRTPDQWLPPLASARCGYAVHWVGQKARWGLSVTEAEAATLRRVLQECTETTMPLFVPSAPATVSVTVPTTTPPTTTITPSAGPAELVLVSCRAREEEVVLANRGGEPADLAGSTLHDEGNKHSTPLGQWGPVAPGATLTILTGEDAVEGPARVVWKRQNVWNNDGDRAFLVGPWGEQSVRC